MSSGLGNFEGTLQTDGYAAYDHVGGPKMVHAACWAHSRRKFFQAAELNLKDQLAIGIVAQRMSFLTLISGRIGELTSGVWAART
jgi:transposase